MDRARPACKTAPVKAVLGGQPLNLAVVGEKEYQQWRELALADEAGCAEAARKNKEALLKSSQERVQNWPNTIEALRRRKDRARKERLDAEEERRCVIDAHEAELERTKRKASIDKANLMLYEQDDRVKNFTSKMVLASVLEERAKQIDITRLRQQAENEMEMKWAVTQEEALRRAMKEEEEKQAMLKRRAIDFKHGQLDQLEAVRQQKLQELREDKEEGRRILKSAQESVQEELEEERKRREHAKKMQEELIVVNENQKAAKAARKHLETLEAERIERFAVLKEQQMQERKKRVEERFQSKLKVRQEIIDRQAQHLKALKDAVVERELKQMRDHEREQELREAQDREKKNAFWKEVVASRSAQLKRREGDAARRQEVFNRMRDTWQQRAVELVEEEIQERVESKQQAMDIEHFQMLQVHEKEMQRAKEKEQKHIESLMVKKALQDDDDMFKGYVNAVMAEYVKAGKSGGVRGSILAKGSDGSSTTVSSNTKK